MSTLITALCCEVSMSAQSCYDKSSSKGSQLSPWGEFHPSLAVIVLTLHLLLWYAQFKDHLLKLLSLVHVLLRQEWKTVDFKDVHIYCWILIGMWTLNKMMINFNFKVLKKETCFLCSLWKMWLLEVDDLIKSRSNIIVFYIGCLGKTS